MFKKYFKSFISILMINKSFHRKFSASQVYTRNLPYYTSDFD
jgi:hypothetical protein